MGNAWRIYYGILALALLIIAMGIAADMWMPPPKLIAFCAVIALAHCFGARCLERNRL